MQCFNTASVLIQRPLIESWRLWILVSIQLLFLFNNLAGKRRKEGIPFQYSFCSYSTKGDINGKKIFLGFQYSFCSYSTSRKLYNLTSLRVSIQLLFLFNCIFRSILLDLHSFNTASVLIQLFNKLPSITCHGCFNTASVLIQLEWLEEAIAFASLFQYSFCSYSTSFHVFSPFYLKVSIQLLFLFNRSVSSPCPRHIRVSIQLLFLFNAWLYRSLLLLLVSIQLLFLFNYKPPNF